MRGLRVVILSCSFALALLCGPTAPAQAAWPHDPNVNVPLCAAVNLQRNPIVISDGSGGAIVTWEDTRSGNYHIYVQRISSAGVAQWTADGVALCTATGDQYYPMIVSDGSGGAIVTWQDNRSGTGDVYVQRISAAGAVQWAANGVALCTATNNQAHPTIASDGAGGAIVTWRDDRSGTSDIYARRVSAAGVPQWTADGVALCAAANSQLNAVIVPDNAGGAIVAWQDFRSSNYDIYAQRISGAGAVQWAADGVAISVATNTQDTPAIATDGAGGAVVTWQDMRGGSNYDVYAQRISSLGAVQWTADGVALCTAASGQSYPTVATDGGSGAIVTWYDGRSGNNDIYAQRVSAAGAVQWTADGVALCTAANGQNSPAIVADGGGGAIVTWYDGRSGNNDIYAQRVSAVGAVQWTAGGVALCTAAGGQLNPTVATDGAGGAVVTWYDGRSGNNDIYAQRIERFGYLGSPEPLIAGATDVPNDQGGQVKLSWYASWLDPAFDTNLAAYDVLRSVPSSVASSALAAGRRVFTLGEGTVLPGAGDIVAQSLGVQTYFWEYLGSVSPIHYVEGYSYIAPTLSDSVGESNPCTAFMVAGRNASGTMFWLSAPDSGYSVDDLAPATPTLFAGQYESGTTMLSWQANGESDFAVYRLYRGQEADFVPAAENLVAERAATGYVDAAGAPYYYKLAAVDIHGNTSPYATLLPSGTTDVAGGPTLAFALEPVRPNPAAGRKLTVAFTLATAGSARLELLDLSGRRVISREVGSLGAGRHAVNLGEGVRVRSGLYFVRLTQGANVRGTRVAVVE